MRLANNGHGIAIDKNGALKNDGFVSVSNIGIDVGNDIGYLLYNNGEVINSDGKTIHLFSSSLYGIYNGNMAKIQSEGRININNLGSSNTPNDFFFVNHGEVVSDSMTISALGGKGILNEVNATFESMSLLSISSLMDTCFVNKGFFKMNSSGNMNLTNTDRALFFNDSNAHSINGGTINFGPRGENAFHNKGLFQNTSSGHFVFSGSGGTISLLNNGTMTTEPGGSIIFNGNQLNAYISNGEGDTLIIHVPVTFNATGSGPMLSNEGYMEFYGGKQNWSGRMWPTIFNGMNGQFTARDTFIVMTTTTFVQNFGDFTFEEGTYIEASNLGNVVINESSGIFHNHAGFTIRRVGSSGFTNHGIFYHHETAELDYGYAGGNGVLNSGTGIFTNYGMIRTNVSGVDSIRGDGVNNSGIFHNYGLIRSGQSSIFFGGEGVRNHTSGSFTNYGCGTIDIWQDNLVLDPANGFNNYGLIIENGTGNSNILMNHNIGVVVNLNGGDFNIGNDEGTYLEGMNYSDLKSMISCIDCQFPYDSDLNACATITNVAEYEPSGFDPCSCSDPFNILNGIGGVQYFHDYVQIEDLLGRTWRLHEVLSGNMLDEFGNLLEEGAMGAVLVDMDIEGNTLPPFTTRLDFYHVPGTGFSAVFSPDEGVTTLIFSNSCATQCNPIPTLRVWGILILGILMIISGVLYARSRYHKIIPQ